MLKCTLRNLPPKVQRTTSRSIRSFDDQTKRTTYATLNKSFLLAIILSTSLSFIPAAAQSPLSLIDPDLPLGGWAFDNGQEFPGAVGKLELKKDETQPRLDLFGNFSKGGNYVQTSKRLANLAIDSVSFDVKVPKGVGSLTMRLIDGTDQCHQLSIRLSDKGGWQRYTFPVARYFESVASGAPMDIVTRYEKWGGANDGKWHQPAKLFVILAGKDALPKAAYPYATQNFSHGRQIDVASTVRLDLFAEQGVGDWELNLGNEFPGATANWLDHIRS